MVSSIILSFSIDKINIKDQAAVCYRIKFQFMLQRYFKRYYWKQKKYSQF